MGYYNNSNRNYANAYEETLKEQKGLQDRLLCEEMGRETKDNFMKVANVLTKLKSDMEQYYDELRSKYDFDEVDQIVKLPKKRLDFIKDLYDRLLGGKE